MCGEGCFKLALHLANSRTWICITQRVLSRCHLPEIRLASIKPTIPLYLWQLTNNRTCPELSIGGFPSIRHNEIRDITADIMSEVCHSVGTEPCLQPVTGEQLRHRSANREVGARLDIVAQSFWGRDRQSAFFDVRVFNPFAPSYHNIPLSQCHKRNEQVKRRAYDERVREIERGSFSPLVFSTSGGMGTTATVVYKRLASLIAEKRDKPYGRTMHWLRCRLNFSPLRSAIMCLRGSRSSIHHPAKPSCINLAYFEGRVQQD